ncbi:hypothetical protein ASG83_07480 [Yonghaparkia sp. Soil809]|nr:hypothetical protein ASG83_07480 [Yonghaparkia sp. Soil809]
MTAAPARSRVEGSRRSRIRRRRRRRIIVAVAVVAVLLASAVGGYLFALAGAYQDNVTAIPDAFPDESLRPQVIDGPAADAMNILLVGSDTRAELGSSNVDEVRNSLADVIMVAHISADRQNVHVMSIPRDTWVEQPSGSMGKINWSFGSGGAAGLVQTVEKLIDARIDHVAAIDFEGFKGMTDALGGVTVNNTIEWQRRGEYFGIGPVELNGERALMYVRERKLTGNDFNRAQQQQEFLRAVLKKTLSGQTLADPGKVYGLVSAISPFLAVDGGLTAPVIVGLATELRDLRASDVQFFTMPNSGASFVGDQAVVLVDDPTRALVAESFRGDDVASLAEAVQKSS